MERNKVRVLCNRNIEYADKQAIQQELGDNNCYVGQITPKTAADVNDLMREKGGTLVIWERAPAEIDLKQLTVTAIHLPVQSEAKTEKPRPVYMFE